MTHSADKSFAEKHPGGARPNPRIRDAIVRRATAEELPCAVAFEIASQLEVPVAEVGLSLDLLNYRLIKCQLGLFGYRPHKKIARPPADLAPNLKEAIEKEAQEGKLACRLAWEIADRLGVPRLRVGGACEAAGIKIKPCQLGAF
jgi:hypothetical protein